LKQAATRFSPKVWRRVDSNLVMTLRLNKTSHRGLARFPHAPLAWAVALSLSAPMLLGCGARGGVRGPALHAERAPATSQVGDDGFAAAVHDLLLTDPGTTERAMRLGAVESRQMSRAASRFGAHAGERGLAAVSGGLYLMRAGDSYQGLFGPQGAEALRGAVHELSVKGDEGRARAAYDLLLTVVPDADRTDIRSHVDALDIWTRDAFGTGGPVASAGGLERVAVHRRMLEPSKEALGDATSATTEWIKRAVVLRDRFRKNRVQPPREEGAEAWRALETGPVVLAALYLRDGDASGGLAAVDRAVARELLEAERPQFATALEAAAQEPSVDRCIDVLHQLRPMTGREPSREGEDFADDRDVFGAAAFGMATECYRLDPTVPEVALTLGVGLAELGMAEATPAVLADAMRAHPEARVASEALAMSLEAIANEEDAGDPEAARRAFRATLPLLTIASAQNLAGKVHPSPARVRAAMGEIELREGRVDDARALFMQSVGQEKLGSVLLSLARIEWRDGHSQAALDHLRDAVSANDAAHDAALRGEILLTISDVTHDQGDAAAARTPLTEALKDLVQSRNVPDADARARVERTLARVLDRFGASQPAQRALERAYAAAPGDKRQATQTIELVIGRAFVRGDLAAAREGLQHAIAADLDTDDLVYFALWVRLLERQLRIASDGSSDRIFAGMDEGAADRSPATAGSAQPSSVAALQERWVATLARFGEGKLKGDELIARAATPIQKYEALFYDAMDHRAAGDTKGGDDLLRQVVAGTGLQLSEVTLARDMLDPSKSQLGGPLPPDVSIP
jgi:tetratricopeptide (TPR) repeat protein